jgi:hypothetical protein
MTQTPLPIILKLILLNGVREDNVKIIYNQKLILHMSYNYSYVSVHIKLPISDGIQVTFVVLITMYLKSLVKINNVPFMTPMLVPLISQKQNVINPCNTTLPWMRFYQPFNA